MKPGRTAIRLTSMQIRLVALAVAAALLAACGGGSSGPTGIKAAGKITGTRLTAFACPTQPGHGAAVSLAASALTKLRLCPLPVLRSSSAVTLAPKAAIYSRLVRSLTLPDQKASPSEVCPMFANVPQLVIGETASGAVLIHIPVDGCGHYLSQSLSALTAARSQP